MILSDIKRYLRERKSASLQDIALHFDVEPDAVRGMLEHWVRKGKVERSTLKASCGDSCNQCEPSTTEVYYWLGDQGAREQVLSIPSICNDHRQ